MVRQGRKATRDRKGWKGRRVPLASKVPWVSKARLDPMGKPVPTALQERWVRLDRLGRKAQWGKLDREGQLDSQASRVPTGRRDRMEPQVRRAFVEIKGLSATSGRMVKQVFKGSPESLECKVLMDRLVHEVSKVSLGSRVPEVNPVNKVYLGRKGRKASRAYQGHKDLAVNLAYRGYPESPDVWVTRDR